MTARNRLLALTLTAAAAGTFVAVATPFAGAAYASAPNLHASVSAGGFLSDGYGAMSSRAVGPGVYEVEFDVDVSACAYVATTVNASTQAVQAFTARGQSAASYVRVETKNQGGGLSPAAFELVVDCGAPTVPFAVIGYDGALARGTASTTVTTDGSGAYTVQFRTSVADCTPIATVGDPGSGVVTSPAGVSVGRAASPKAVYVETKNPGGGLQPGVPFHLVVICPGTQGAAGLAVRSDGVALRSYGDALSFRGANGRYTVVTRRDITACSTVVTRGSLTRTAPFTPTTTEVTDGVAANTVVVQVRDLLSGGGAFTNQSFYAAVLCS